MCALQATAGFIVGRNGNNNAKIERVTQYSKGTESDANAGKRAGLVLYVPATFIHSCVFCNSFAAYQPPGPLEQAAPLLPPLGPAAAPPPLQCPGA